MTALGGSFRLADIRSSAIAPRTTDAVSTPASPTESIADFARAVISAAPRIDAGTYFPGLETVARLARTLKRPAHATRTVVEQLHEERINTVTHALGFALSVAGFAYLLTLAIMSGGWLRVTSCGVYGATLVLVYAASTSFHAVQCPHRKRRLQLCDHVAIYLLIAGTYTPLTASLMQGRVGFTLLACVWSFAAIGIAIKVKYAARLQDTSPLPCLGLGWLVLFAVKPLLAVMPMGGMVLLVGGGVSYSAGLLFYCRDDKPYFHAIWHLFVIAGTALHYGTIVLYV